MHTQKTDAKEEKEKAQGLGGEKERKEKKRSRSGNYARRRDQPFTTPFFFFSFLFFLV